MTVHSILESARGRSLACALVSASLLFFPASTRAHSAPAVVAIVDEDDSGVRVLRLNDGLAQRSGDAWHFVCPSMYNGVGQDLAAAMPGGGVAIASPTGIWVMRHDGTLAPHPDLEAHSMVTAFARGPSTLYALQVNAQQHVNEVIEVSADKVRVLWTDTRFWSDIAVGDTQLHLVRFEQDSVEELQLSFAGDVIAQQSATLVDAHQVSVRPLADVPYFVAALERTVELGRIESGSWRVVRAAASSIAGPVETADGTGFVALDGQLSTFDEEMVTPRTDTDFVTGLSRLIDHAYACTRTGLRDLSSDGLGDTLFDLSQLQAPDLCSLPEAARSTCNLEWQHFQVELLGANIPLVATEPASAECPPRSGDAEASADAGASAAITSSSADSGTGPSAPPATSSGCSIGRGPVRPAVPPAGAVVILCALAAVRRRRCQPARR